MKQKDKLCKHKFRFADFLRTQNKDLYAILYCEKCGFVEMQLIMTKLEIDLN